MFFVWFGLSWSRGFARRAVGRARRTNKSTTNRIARCFGTAKTESCVGRRKLESRLAQEAAERSAKIRSESEQMRRKLLAEADVEASKNRAAALLALETNMIVKRQESEREERFVTLREETEVKLSLFVFFGFHCFQIRDGIKK
jgi:hypothetical protein